MATWPWYGALASGLLYDSAEFLQVQTYENLNRWAKQIAARPAVQRGPLSIVRGVIRRRWNAIARRILMPYWMLNKKAGF